MGSKRRNPFPGVWILPASALLFAACNAERGPCLEPVTAQVNVSCVQYIDSSRSYADTFLTNANFVSLDIDSASRWVMGAKKAAKFSIVLSPLHDTTRWRIQADSNVSPADTLTFIYERKLKFLSNACGYSYTYLLKQVLATRNTLDSVSINSFEVTNKAGTEHVRIYY